MNNTRSTVHLLDPKNSFLPPQLNNRETPTHNQPENDRMKVKMTTVDGENNSCDENRKNKHLTTVNLTKIKPENDGKQPVKIGAFTKRVLI